jgi:26S proteasome regulatory subunit N7
VYKGLYKLAIRSFSEAAELFLETVSTFTTTELLSYGEFIGLTVLVALVSLDRPTLKEKVRGTR